MLEDLQSSINKALKVDKNLEMPAEEWTVRNYDEVTGYAGRARKPMIDWVTEYNYVTKQDLTREEFEKLLNEKYTLSGQIYQPKKMRLRYTNGDVYYRYIQKTVMF